MIGRNYHIQDYLRILCKFIYVSNGKFLNWVCLSILILGVFRTKQEKAAWQFIATTTILITLQINLQADNNMA